MFCDYFRLTSHTLNEYDDDDDNDDDIQARTMPQLGTSTWWKLARKPRVASGFQDGRHGGGR